MKLSFYGADRNVTGSCHMVECAGKRVLIDCGLYQGSRELAEENAEPFAFDPAGVDYVLLTHAHLDHCGRLPLLDKRGFRGEIITTDATAELAKVVLLDSAHLQEEDARFRTKNQRRPVEPLYTLVDALHSLDHLGREAVYDTPLDLAPGIRATFIDAGHILGSASILLELSEAGKRATVLYSGDLGKPSGLLLKGPAKPPHADVVVMETTYGNRLHKPLAPSIEEFYVAVAETFQRGGNVIIPTFALERAQEVLFVINQGIESNRLPPSAQVFVDSPMAISATEIMGRHLDDLQPAIADRIKSGHDPFHFPGLRFTPQHADSMAINEVKSGAIIMAGSGMCTGGRVRHHLRHNLSRPESTVVFVGYAAVGTLARDIIDGAKDVRIFGEHVPVRARIHTINGFSAHADQAQLLDWHRQIAPGRTFLIHGEADTMQSFATLLSGGQVDMPRLNQVFEL
ncbi:MAG: MBL fold metallo-hydrolase [Alphaproteobacteria bacterium]|nr:MBL fold metallo-hydrolase [Alphaproteobacteria bacterium]